MLWLSIALAAPAASGAAALNVTPGLPVRGDPVTVSARGFAPHARGAVTLLGASSRQFRADAHGRAAIVLRLRRSAPSGSRMLRVRAGARRITARLTVLVRRSAPSTLAALSGGQRVLLYPSRVRAGERFKLRISGFVRGAPLTVRVGATTVARRRAGPRGRLALSLTVPAIAAGDHRIVVRSGRIILSLPFQLQPGLDSAPPPPSRPLPAPQAPPLAAPPPADAAVLVGAGDIAGCNNPGDESTAALLDTIAGTVFTTGDNVYPTGTLSNYNTCYAPSWGRHKSRTRPALGNHDYADASGSTGIFDYFGVNAGPVGGGYYSYDLGAWHVVVLNSNCSFVGGCHAGSVQEQWLRADLAAHPTSCTVAMWHHPRFSSGSEHDGNATMQPFWQALYDAGAEIVLNGHEHIYERFAPMNAAGAPDLNFGMREFIVGTGGFSHHPLSTPLATSQVRNADTFGVLKLTLRNSGYDWRFIPEAGRTFTDSGAGGCHATPAP